ncbi:hypothetical protein K504DRAFT_505557 [Pleomassaria siparia CBS 279.74]|uniref:F-box domain-containing protein n=1 Tax=Pleomassaria siparia CBS 279.74 TaxID=1314801 RepID=A0A6G1JYZ0_9PLEO|nr:hypothetical protein K504DRAFT_505557 [Pleomassaria siparia CBS 279.74]
MASSTSPVEDKPVTKTSQVIKTPDSITIRLFNLEDAEKIVREALSDPGNSKLIWTIEIETSNPDDEEDDEDIDIQLVENMMGGADLADLLDGAGTDDDAASIDAADERPIGSDDDDDDEDSDDEAKNDTAMNNFCEPIIELLDAIHSSSGSLESFSWDNQPGWWDSKGHRPAAFWTALWKHSSTLQRLRIGFYTHELHNVSVPSPTKPFPLLHDLYIDAGTTHGNDGSAVDSLLSLCPSLTTLDFSWPGCDLDDCQIKNISWDYHYPQLRSLTLYGGDFAPDAFAAFLDRNPSIEVFVDGVDGDCREPYGEQGGPGLKAETLPNVRCVSRASDSARYPEDWFDDKSARKVVHLGLPWTTRDGFAVSETAARELKCLDINASINYWRPDEVDSDDEEEEKKRIRTDPSKPLVKSTRKLLPQLKQLRELGIRMASQSSTMRLPDGSFGSPPGMNEEDVKNILSVLPSSDTQIRALRLWDTAGKALPQSFLDDFPRIPTSLEYLSWEAEVPVLYQLTKQENGKVRARPCEPLRVVPEGRKGDWNEKRILDY